MFFQIITYSLVAGSLLGTYLGIPNIYSPPKISISEYLKKSEKSEPNIVKHDTQSNARHLWTRSLKIKKKEVFSNFQKQ